MYTLRVFHSLTHSELFIPDSRDLMTKQKKKKEKIMVAAINKELQFDWIMRSSNDRHSTGSFSSLVDVYTKR